MRTILLALGLILPLGALGQYQIVTYSVDAGGGTSSGGGYSLSGTIGQPDAGTLTGDPYTVHGGFWPTVVVPGQGEVPAITILFTNGNVVVTWTPEAEGFQLEQTDNLTAPTWSSGPDGNPTLPFAPAGTARFYRLRKP